MTMAEMWNGVADAWERNAAFIDEHVAEATERMLDLAGVGPGAAVLEVACGPGGAGLAAADRTGAGGRVVLADVAEEMVAVAARRAGGRPGVETTVCDQIALAAPDGSFDAVLSRFGLMFTEPPEDAVREQRRVARPGGAVAAMVWGPREENPWLGVLFDAVGAQFGVQFPPPHVAGPFALHDRARFEGVLSAAGLEDVVVEHVVQPMRVPDVEAWWGFTSQIAGPAAVAMAGLEPEVRDQIRERALAGAREAARPASDGIELSGSVLIGCGRRPAG